MPAPSSSPIDPAIGHLVEVAADATKDQPGLLGVLARVADPRHRRGVRHKLAAILGLALCAVVAGARSFTAIAEWAADADEQTLHSLEITGAVPSESTFRRTLQRLDADCGCREPMPPGDIHESHLRRGHASGCGSGPGW